MKMNPEQQLAVRVQLRRMAAMAQTLPLSEFLGAIAGDDPLRPLTMALKKFQAEGMEVEKREVAHVG